MVTQKIGATLKPKRNWRRVEFNDRLNSQSMININCNYVFPKQFTPFPINSIYGKKRELKTKENIVEKIIF